MEFEDILKGTGRTTRAVEAAEARGWLSRLYSAYDWRLELALPTLARASSLAEDDLVASHFQAVLQDWTRWARERRKTEREINDSQRAREYQKEEKSDSSE